MNIGQMLSRLKHNREVAEIRWLDREIKEKQENIRKLREELGIPAGTPAFGAGAGAHNPT